MGRVGQRKGGNKQGAQTDKLVKVCCQLVLFQFLFLFGRQATGHKQRHRQKASQVGPKGGWMGAAIAGMLDGKMGNGGVTQSRHRHLSESVER